MAISREEVQHLASLCRIGMNEEDLKELPEQLSHILEMFQVLQELDTTDIPPTGQSPSAAMAMRADEPQSSLPREDVLANAPRQEGDLLRVKAVLEE